MSCPRSWKRSRRRSLAGCICRSFTTRGVRLSRFLAIARRDRRHLHARLQVLGKRDGHGLAKAKDYPDRAREAILEMHRQVGVLKYGPDGLAQRGVLVRHLVMPGQSAETEQICRWLAEEVSRDTYINIMGQLPADIPGGADWPGWRRSQVRRDRPAAGNRRDRSGLQGSTSSRALAIRRR